jgi:hypothetical protein
MKTKPYDINRLKYEAGDIPTPTCPLINNCLQEIRRVASDLEYMKRNVSRYDDIDDFVSDLPDLDEGFLVDRLEAIREANEQLRGLGEYWYERFKEILEE